MAEPMMGVIGGPPLPKADPLLDLELPRGGTIRQTAEAEVRSQLGILGVSNAHTRPFNEVTLDYWRMLRRIGDAASEKAISEWLAQHRT